MRLVSFSEYELGVFAFGGTPTGIVAIGLMPVGIVAIGTLPIGLVTAACGGGLGLVNVTCGIGVGAWVWCTGLAIGGDVHCVGLGLPLAGKRPTEGGTASYWARLAAVAVVLLVPLYFVGQARLGLASMTRVAEATWAAKPELTEGLYLDPESECQVHAHLRSDGEARLHATMTVTCGSLVLASREARSGCDVRQQPRDGGTVYDLACTAERVAESSDEDTVYPEEPGVELNTFGEAGGEVRVFAHGPPPMNVVLTVDSPSQRVEGEPLLLDRRTRLDAD